MVIDASGREVLREKAADRIGVVSTTEDELVIGGRAFFVRDGFLFLRSPLTKVAPVPGTSLCIISHSGGDAEVVVVEEGEEGWWWGMSL